MSSSPAARKDVREAAELISDLSMRVRGHCGNRTPHEAMLAGEGNDDLGFVGITLTYRETRLLLDLERPLANTREDSQQGTARLVQTQRSRPWLPRGCLRMSSGKRA